MLGRLVLRGLVAGVLGGAAFGLVLGLLEAVQQSSVGPIVGYLAAGVFFGAFLGFGPGVAVGLALALAGALAGDAAVWLARLVAITAATVSVAIVWLGIGGGPNGRDALGLALMSGVPGLIAACAASWIRRPPADPARTHG